MNCSLMKNRSQKRTKHQVPINPDLGLCSLDCVEVSSKKESPEDMLLAKEVWESVRHAMNDLPEHYRKVFHLRDILGLSMRETSESLNLSEKAAKSRLRRSRRHLRNCLSSLHGPSA